MKNIDELKSYLNMVSKSIEGKSPRKKKKVWKSHLQNIKRILES